MPRRPDRSQVSVTVTAETKDAAEKAASKLDMSKADFYRYCLRLGIEQAGLLPPDEIPKRGK